VSRLHIEGLRFQHRGPIDLTIDSGECVALSGPSGSGKTLLLRAVADLDPHEGHVFLDGSESQSVEPPVWRRRVGLLFPESRWWFETVGEHIGELEPRWLAQLGLDPGVLRWPVAHLSTGERQRLAVVRLLANRPEALLLDEPTANLDSESAVRMETLLADYRSETGTAVLWVSHDPVQARRVASRLFRLEDGRLVEEGAL
jgi:ABC-type sulfate/molybdate transport systems ATPase subunit